MRRHYRTSPPQGVSSALFALLLVFTFPIWLPIWAKFVELVGAVLGQVIGGLR